MKIDIFIECFLINSLLRNKKLHFKTKDFHRFITDKIKGLKYKNLFLYIAFSL